jgi:hypothetical protein
MGMKVVINSCFGGFGLSKEAVAELVKRGGKDPRNSESDRCDPLLIQVIEEMGNAASGDFSKVRIVEVPDEVDWEIDEYDGYEHIAEKHRTWS